MENQPFDGHWGGLLDISRLRIKGPLEIEISCPGFVPALADPSVQDQRKLGIALRRFMLVE